MCFLPAELQFPILRSRGFESGNRFALSNGDFLSGRRDAGAVMMVTLSRALALFALAFEKSNGGCLIWGNFASWDFEGGGNLFWRGMLL